MGNQESNEQIFGDNQPYTLIDVREKSEWDMGHCDSAILIPSGQIREKIESVVPNKTSKVLLYCRAGGRAARCANILFNMGYTNVHNLGGFPNAKRLVEQYPSP